MLRRNSYAGMQHSLLEKNSFDHIKDINFNFATYNVLKTKVIPTFY